MRMLNVHTLVRRGRPGWAGPWQAQGLQPDHFALAAFRLPLSGICAHPRCGEVIKEGAMARRYHRITKPETGKEDALAYFNADPWKPCKLREISPIEQMYGYYTAG